jgi:hypothetical protein
MGSLTCQLALSAPPPTRGQFSKLTASLLPLTDLPDASEPPSLGSPQCQALRRLPIPRAAFPVSAPCAERNPLGRHSKPSRIRLPHAAPSAAATTLASVGAAFCLSQQVPPAPPAAQAATHHAAVLDAAYEPDPSSAQLLTATREATAHTPGSARPAAYTVRPGDSLSAIAGRIYHNPAAWPVLYWRNRSEVRWADVIETGQVLRIPAEPARIPGPPALLGPPPVRGVAAYAPRHASLAPVAAQAAPAQAAPVQAAAPAASTYSGGVPAARSVSAWSPGSPAAKPRS